jgi:hypothetical protein
LLDLISGSGVGAGGGAIGVAAKIKENTNLPRQYNEVPEGPPSVNKSCNTRQIKVQARKTNTRSRLTGMLDPSRLRHIGPKRRRCALSASKIGSFSSRMKSDAFGLRCKHLEGTRHRAQLETGRTSSTRAPG